jgi:1-deoxy-D-xylulose-5-phosphate reductoisomerase
MMNKGLEFIEARLLFNARFEQIDVVIHPQSIIHSMVSYNDGSVLAQMGQPDMRTPIAHTLSYPERIESGVSPLDFSQLKSFTFSEADFERFPNLRLALEASQQGQGATTVLNAANEVAVEEFLNNNIKFTDIALVNEFVLNKLGSSPAVDLEQIIELDLLARAEAKKFAESASAK